jgi:hypothetical protein
MAAVSQVGLQRAGELGDRRDPLLQLALASLAFFLLGVQFLATVVGLFAHYAQRSLAERRAIKSAPRT